MIRTVGVFCVFCILFTSPAPVSAQANVEIKSETKVLKDGTLTVTIVLKNIGTSEAKDYLVTTQPFNVRKEKGEKSYDAATKQAQSVTIGAKKEATLTFTFTGADAKDWKWKYTDVYEPKVKKPAATSLGAWDPVLVPAGPGSSFEQYVPLFYPDAAREIRGGAATSFQFVIDALSLPPGWILSEFDPAPGLSFVLTPDTDLYLEMAFATSAMLVVGQTAFVDYTMIDVEDDLRYHGRFAVLVVPEPSTWFLFSFGLLLATSVVRRACSRPATG